MLVNDSYQVGRFRFGEDSLEKGAAVQIDAHLKPFVPIEQVEAGDAGWRPRRWRDLPVAAAWRQQRAGPEETVIAGSVSVCEFEVTVESVAQDLLLRSPGPFGLCPQRGLRVRTEAEIGGHEAMVPRVVLKTVQLARCSH